MKIFAIKDHNLNDKNIGYLFCYEKANEYIIELEKDLDEWDAPLLFQQKVSRKQFTISRGDSFLWVKERVIPSSRQNLGYILKNAKMKEYNELLFLMANNGRCSQDECFLVKVEEEQLPKEIQSRYERNLVECFASDHNSIVCLFKDNHVCKISLEKLALDYKELEVVLKNPRLLKSVKVTVGGYSISFNDSIDIAADVLRKSQYSESLTASDFIRFTEEIVIDTTKSCDILGCSRQNISYLVNTGKMKPIINGTKENFFTIGDVERIKNE